ncbi:MAG: hypothetical protein HUK08_07305 [Bacteroidaceae bacterium]|nr:hypothetical protein [Bacteroidaceae bacterium]
MRILLTSVLSIIVLGAGGWLYVMYRPTTRIYNIYSSLVAGAPMQREQAPELCDFVIWNLPGGLWSTSYILAIDAISRLTKQTSHRLAWAAVVPALGVVSELLQLAGILPGVFDIADIACYGIPYIIATVYRKTDPQKHL